MARDPLLARVARASLCVWERPLAASLLAGVVYLLIATIHGGIWGINKFSFFNYLADALLHGQLHLRVLPPSVKDLSYFGNGRYYLYWPPLPAILLVPFVAAFGVGFSDTLFTVSIAACNVMMVAWLLRLAAIRGVARTRREQRGLLVLFIALGTVHATLAPYGRVWYTAQIVGFGCTLLAYLAVLRWNGTASAAFAGCAITAAFLTRNHLLLAGLWPAYYVLHQNRSRPPRAILRLVVAGLAPIVLAILVYGFYNWQRFGNPFDQGIAYHAMDNIYRADYQRYGTFSLHYVPTNLYYQFVAYPFPYREESVMGASLFLMSPVFVAAFAGVLRQRQWMSSWVLVASIICVAMPILLLMGTGWVQWGPRYTLDYTVPLLLLTAIGIRRWQLWLLGLLTIISIVHYTLGAPIGYGG